MLKHNISLLKGEGLEPEYMQNISMQLEKMISGYKKLKEQLLVNFENIKSEEFHKLNIEIIKTNDLLGEQERETARLVGMLKKEAERKNKNEIRLRDLMSEKDFKLKEVIEELLEVENEVRNQLKINSELTTLLRDVRTSLIDTIAQVTKDESPEKRKTSIMLDKEF